jgi:hypothetical protein
VGDINGTVTDPDAAAVVGGSVTAVNIDTNQSRSVATDASGRYLLLALPPGPYRITATATGFRAVSAPVFELRIGDTRTVDIALTLAGVVETVTVTATALPIDLSRTSISTVITRDQIESLPINGRNFIEFAALTAGAARDRTPQQGASMTSGVSFTGQRARSNNIMVDGLDNNDLVVGAVRIAFSQDAVREFQVVANSFSAEYGKASAGLINIVTKGGTNAWHGTSFLYFRDRGLNAKNHFEKFDVFGNPIEREKAPFDQRQWGGTLGGPLRRDKLFVFASLERSSTNASRFVTIDPAAVDALNAAGFPVESGNVPLEAASSSWFGRVDAQFAPGHSLVARSVYATVDREGIDDFGGIVARSRGTVQQRKDWSASASHTALMTERVLNELRFQYAWQDQKVLTLDPLDGPTLELTAVASVGRQRLTPQLRRNHRLEMIETISHVFGQHQVKAGAELVYQHSPGADNQLPLHFGGRYIFSAIPALGLRTSLEGLQRGIPAAYVQGYGTAEYPDVGYTELSLFAQDEWRRGRWVLKPGVRYQRQFWQQHTYTASDLAGTSFSYPLKGDADNIAPRIAVGHTLTSDGATVVRAAYGMFFDNIISAVPSVGRLIDGSATGVRTLVLPAPRASLAWNAPGHRLTEAEALALLGGPYVSSVITADPSLKTSYTHQVSAGIDRGLGAAATLSVNAVYVRGFNMPGTLDYNPVLPARLGPGRRPNDRPCSANPAATCVNGGIPGTSASVVQYTSFGESWYKGVTISLTGRLGGEAQFQVAYTLSRAEDTSTDFQSGFVPQSSGFGRNPDDRAGLPLGFDPRAERGLASHDQQHRLAASFVYALPWDLQVTGIVYAGSGQPFSPLAGADLNGDGDAGGFPTDRARQNPADESTSVGRHSERTAPQITVDTRVSRPFRIGRLTIEAMLETFNLLNRTNYVEDTNQSSFVIFGTGAFPANPLPTYRRYTQAMPPRQVQLAGRIKF